MTLLVTPHLTADSDLDRKIAATHRGMAHWAGTGPDGTTCGACEHFKPQRNNSCGRQVRQGPAGGAEDARGHGQVPGFDRELPALRGAAMSSAQAHQTHRWTRHSRCTPRHVARGFRHPRATHQSLRRIEHSALAQVRNQTERTDPMPSIRDEFPSNWLKPVDIPGGAVEATISAVAIERFGDDKKVVLTFAGLPKRKICGATDRTFLADNFGDKTEDWVRQIVKIHVTKAMDPRVRKLVDVTRLDLPQPPASKPVKVAPNARARQETARRADPACERLRGPRRRDPRRGPVCPRGSGVILCR